MTDSPRNGAAWEHLSTRIADAWPLRRWRDVGVVVGCSGGADSVGLLTALCHLRQSAMAGPDPPRGFLVVAHFNHGLRGEESDGDESFVCELAARLDVRWITRHATGTDRDEASMRAQRFRFLQDAAGATGARYIVLGHTADDNVETVLHQLMRGTGPAGLAGIGTPRSVGQDLVLVRPLLGISRGLVREGLDCIGQPWREDSSNTDIDYRRNWIRHQLIPLIESEYPDAFAAITRAVEGQREWRQVIDRMAGQWLATHLRSSDPPILDRESQTEQAIVVAAVQMLWTQLDWPRGEMTRDHWLRLANTIQSNAQQRYSLPGQVDVVSKGASIQISRPQAL